MLLNHMTKATRHKYFLDFTEAGDPVYDLDRLSTKQSVSDTSCIILPYSLEVSLASDLVIHAQLENT